MRASAIRGLAVIAAASLTGCAAAAAPARPGGHSWRVAYNGYGTVLVLARHRAETTIRLSPAPPGGGGSNHAALVLSKRGWHDLVIDVRLRTNRQLRLPRPKPWEVGWVLWHYRDDKHFYYLALKPNGWELGKEDPGYPGNQRYLATGTTPDFPLGRWYRVRVRQSGAAIAVSVDGRPLARLTDTQHPYLAGRIGLYAEDASATFQPLSATAR
jgi:hypothetical protein